MKLKKSLLFLCVLCVMQSMKAVDILPNTNYVIYNAYSQFSNICLQDDHSVGTNPNFLYSYAVRDTTNNRQLWTFIQDATDSTRYIIRNVRSRIYLSAEYVSMGKFNKLQSQTVKGATVAWKVTPIKGTDQVELSAVDNYGVSFYMHASDTTVTPQTYRNNTLLSRNSRFAWRIVLAKDTTKTTAINAVTTNNNCIQVRNRRIYVPSGIDYSIFNMEGKLMATDRELIPGIYIVRTKNESIKVEIK